MTDTEQSASIRAPEPLGPVDRLAGVLVPPMDALGGRGTIVAPLIVVFAVALLAAGAAWAWAESAPAGSGAALLRASSYLVWLLALASPVAAALKGAVFAAMAWGMLVLLGGTPRVRPLVSALFYGEAILSVQALWVTAGALVLGRAAPASGAFPVPSGLDAFVGPDAAVLLAVAQQVTPFHLAWGIFLLLAFASHGGVSRWRGAGVALCLWCLGVGLAALRVPTG